LTDGRLLRTHTSCVQVRTMESVKALPVRIIAPGAAYRRDDDRRHAPQRLQPARRPLRRPEVEPRRPERHARVLLPRDLRPADRQVRFRPHFFPFTEPSFEIDIKLEAKGKEPPLDRNRRLRQWSIPPCSTQIAQDARRRSASIADKVTGFAFGLGLGAPRDDPARHHGYSSLDRERHALPGQFA